MVISRDDIAAQIATGFGLTKSDSLRMVDLFFSEIMESLQRGDIAKIANFGTFQTIKKSERIGRNPKTGEPAIIHSRKTPVFRPSIGVKEKINK